MKKIIISLLVLLSFEAAAKDGAYVGVNLNHSHAQHRVGGVDTTSYTISSYDNMSYTDAKNVGFGFEAGYKISFDGIYLAPEIFFDQLNNNAEDPSANINLASSANFVQDRLILNYRYGAKLNVGHNFTDKFSVFLTGGFANVDYDVNWNSLQGSSDVGYSSYGADKLALLYGFGVAYDVSENLAAKLTFDRQDFAIRYSLDGWRSSVELDVIRLGVAWGF